MQLRDGEHQAHLEWDGLGPAPCPTTPTPPGRSRMPWRGATTSRPAGSAATSWSAASASRFDGFGQRDHSWGFRHWAGLHQWHWVTGFLADGRAFNLFEVLTTTTTRRSTASCRTADGTSTWWPPTATCVRSTDGGAERLTLTPRPADGGHELPVTGERAGASIPVRPAADQPVIVHETPMRLSVRRRAEGYGIYEHLVTEFD